MAENGNQDRDTPPQFVVPYRTVTQPITRRFPTAEVLAGKHQINRVKSSRYHGLHEYGLNEIVEYPETGRHEGEKIAHKFKVDPDNFFNPLYNTQYSKGPGPGTEANPSGHHGGHHGMRCSLIPAADKHQGGAKCFRQGTSCLGVKTCTFQPTYDPSSSPPQPDLSAKGRARRDALERTLALYRALMHRGCSPPTDDDDDNLDILDARSEDEALPESSFPRDPRSQIQPLCKGQLVMEEWSDGASKVIRCEHWKNGSRGHLALFNLQEYNTDYLAALINGNNEVANRFEVAAQKEGYGPLVACDHSIAISQQATLCPHLHRLSNGTLARVPYSRREGCTARFYSYVPESPEDFTHSPYAVLICENPHNHPDPSPISTPPPFESVLNGLLHEQGWQIANATPRRLATNQKFLAGLRTQLAEPPLDREPILADLHPSFANADHTRVYIDKVRLAHYPHGTDFEGAQTQLEKDALLPLEQRYVRRAEEVTFKGVTFRQVICMFPSQSRHLIRRARFLQIDTAFKRVKGWKEFEIMAWDNDTHTSHVLGRAFITSLTAEAHHFLFRSIFEIAEADAGTTARFRHIHGDGIDEADFQTSLQDPEDVLGAPNTQEPRCLNAITADEHKGEAKGWGDFLVERTQSAGLAVDDPLLKLGPYEHLAHCYRLCCVHHQRGVVGATQSLPPEIMPKIKSAMHRLTCIDPAHEDFEELKEVIRSGGTKCSNWLDDKLTGAPFAMAALNPHFSKMPKEVWDATPSTSNGVESVHRDANRDGTALSLLAGINIGRQRDARQMATAAVVLSTNVQVSYIQNDAYKRVDSSLARSVRASKKTTSMANENADSSRQAQRAVIGEASRVASIAKPPTPPPPRTSLRGRPLLQPSRLGASQQPEATALSLADYEQHLATLRDRQADLERLEQEERRWVVRGSKGFDTPLDPDTVLQKSRLSEAFTWIEAKIRSLTSSSLASTSESLPPDLEAGFTPDRIAINDTQLVADLPPRNPVPSTSAQSVVPRLGPVHSYLPSLPTATAAPPLPSSLYPALALSQATTSSNIHGASSSHPHPPAFLAPNPQYRPASTSNSSTYAQNSQQGSMASAWSRYYYHYHAARAAYAQMGYPMYTYPPTPQTVVTAPGPGVERPATPERPPLAALQHSPPTPRVDKAKRHRQAGSKSTSNDVE